MTAIWQNDGPGWRLSAPIGFPDEQTLHDLVEETPQILPLAGDPRLVVVGNEVGWAKVKKKAERLRSQRKLDPRIWPNEHHLDTTGNVIPCKTRQTGPIVLGKRLTRVI